MSELDQPAPDEGFAPGEKLFAWVAVGLTTDGDEAHAEGALSAPDADAAGAVAERMLPALQESIGPGAPRLKVRAWVWEVPLEAAVDLLRANGYTVEPPRDGRA